MKLDVEKNFRFETLNQKLVTRREYYRGRFWALSELFDSVDCSLKDKILNEMNLTKSKIDYLGNLSCSLISTACAGGYVF